MSIAVMNWVGANSPTSGNERLMLLALADACSRDDGTGVGRRLPRSPARPTSPIARSSGLCDRRDRSALIDDTRSSPWAPMGQRCDIGVFASGSCRLECLARVRELGDESLVEDDVQVLAPAGQGLVSDRTRGIFSR